MATDFFQRQAAARKSTGWLLAMFGLSAAAVVAVTTLVAMLAIEAHREGIGPSSSLSGGPYPWQAPVGVAMGALALVGGGSAFKIAALRLGGGRSVAEGLGGRRIDPATSDPDQRRLMNVVEEMAIASGVPAPPVYLLDESAVNAFAAGYSPSDAVLGVTRGAVQDLSRDELQGVIAHEFSHVLNGDMRMNIRMIGVLHGILLLGLIGRVVLRAIFNSGVRIDSRRSDNDSGKGGAAVIVVILIAGALVVLGSVGTFLGALIKAAVSRQREFLADASAVQFTRNPEGIAGALKKILAMARRSELRHPRAAECNHMYFSQGVWEGFSSLMATHPPLVDRIRALDPRWDGRDSEGKAEVGGGDRTSRSESPRVEEAAAGFAAAGRQEFDGPPVHELDIAPVGAVRGASDEVGDPERRHRVYAAELLRAIPEELARAARETYAARAVVYVLLLDRDPQTRQAQLDALAEHADEGLLTVVHRLAPTADALDARLRLPLVDLTLPALAGMSQRQYQRFQRSFRSLVLADRRVGLFEWVLAQVLARHLRPKFEGVDRPRLGYDSLRGLGRECSVILSTLAYAGQRGAQAEAAFAAGAARLQGAPVRLLDESACGLEPLRDALEEVCRATELPRKRVIDAAAAAICVDGQVTVVEAELLRGVADLLDCPMPPLLAGQEITVAARA